MPIQHITELFALDGHVLITEVYRNLLKREPDEHGMAYYLGRLAQGYGKAAVIAQLAQSPECRPFDEIKGLKKLVVDERRAQHWLWGRFGHRNRVERILRGNPAALSHVDQHLISLHSAALNNTKQIDELVQHVAHLQNIVLATTCANQDQQLSRENFQLTSSTVAGLPEWVSNETLDKVRALIGTGCSKA